MLDHVFRLNPAFALVSWRDLSEDQRARLRLALPESENVAIVHAPREAFRPIKALSEDLAWLIAELAPGRALSASLGPAWWRSVPELRAILLELVLDGILEVRVDGRFTSGVAALRSLLPEESAPAFDAPTVEETATQALSREAIQSALVSPRKDPLAVAILLYVFNRIPWSRSWRRRVSDDRALLRLLDLRDDGSWDGMPRGVVRRMASTRSGPTQEAFHRYWFLWRLSRTPIPRGRSVIKVYFSPYPNALTEVFRAVRRSAPEAGALSMKVARALPGILRPDKLIVYFADPAPALIFARGIASTLKPIAGQGTPFTYQVDPASALVSLGVDPPRVSAPASSWRLFLTTKLSLAVLDARRTGTAKPLEQIRAYLAFLGVDSRTWRPLRGDWAVEFNAKDPDHGAIERAG